MVTVQRYVESEIEDRVVGTQVVRPEEALLSQLERCREETEHREEHGELEQHGETASEHAHTRLAVQVHGLLLLLKGIFLTRVLGIDLVQLRPEDIHLGRRHVGLEGQRRYDQLDQNCQQQNDDAVVADEAAEEVEDGDDDTRRG